MKKKQTAVEWLVNCIESMNWGEITTRKELYDKAKAMEKEQIEPLLEKAIQERDYYYNLWKKANAYIVKK